jgi:hypothetical protein
MTKEDPMETILIPEILFAIAQGWVHTFNLELIRVTTQIPWA